MWDETHASLGSARRRGPNSMPTERLVAGQPNLPHRMFVPSGTPTHIHLVSAEHAPA